MQSTPSESIVTPRGGAILRLLVRNHPGVMSHVCGLFARRAFNVEGILCLPIGDGTRSVIVLAVNEMHFLEAANEGFLNLTTIYDKDEAEGAHPAVHSRHFAILGQPVVTQYQGFCEAKG